MRSERTNGRRPPGDPAFVDPPVTRRSALPEPEESAVQPSPWALIQKLLKEGGLASFLAAGVLPIKMHEPESELMRRAESVFASCILNQAAEEEKGGLMRLLLVTAHNIAQWSDVCARVTYKAMRPVARETYEFVSPETGAKVLVEDLPGDPKMHTVVNAWKMWGKGWTLEGQTKPSIKLSLIPGPCIEYDPNVRTKVTFDDGDCYMCDMPGGSVTGIATGKMRFACKGNANVTNATSSFSTEVDMTEPGMLSKDPRRRVKGKVFREGKELEGISIRGRWNDRLVATWEVKDGEAKELLLWEKEADSARDSSQYQMGLNSIQLNHLDPGLLAVLPPTDSRLRSDMRALERGRFSTAEKEYQLLLGVDSPSRSGKAAKRIPTWFEKNEEPTAWMSFRYKGGYWEARAAKARGDKRAWAACPDIFGLGAEYDSSMPQLDNLRLQSDNTRSHIVMSSK